MEHDRFVFVSDFDGTLTERDFYKIMIDKYLPERGMELYNDWKNKEYKDIEFLNELFCCLSLSEEELLAEILAIPFDPTAITTIHAIWDAGGMFVILSAGTSYYIQPLLEHYGLKDVMVYSNTAEYKDGGIHLLEDDAAPFYSDYYGINKEKVLKFLRKEFPTIYYAGDSAPDISACKLADVCFAKGDLLHMLEKQGIPCIPIASFKDVHDILLERGVLLS